MSLPGCCLLIVLSFLFSSCPQSFPASGSFPMSQFCTSGGQSIGVSASASVLPMNQFSSVAQSCLTLCSPMTAACQASLSITNFWSLLKLMSTESVTPYNHLILCCPPLLPSSIFPSIRVFSNESVFRIRWPEYWSFSFSNSPSNECSGLISFRMDWLDLLSVQGTLKNILQSTVQKHHSSALSFL